MQATVFIQSFVLLAAGITFTAGAHTNSLPPAPPPAPLFSLPGPGLRPIAAAPPALKPAPQPPAEKIKPVDTRPADNQPAVAFVSRTYGAWDFEHARSWHGHYEIELPERRPDDLFTRGVNAIFVPEVIHVGKTTVACSVWTAIKRKNPLCLINPIPLNVSW